MWHGISSIERRNRSAVGGAMLNAAFPHAHDRAQRVLSLEYAVAPFVQNIGCAITKQLFGGTVPETNLSFRSYDKCRIRRSLQQLVHITRKHN
jgi:hypothetical protein